MLYPPAVVLKLELQVIVVAPLIVDDIDRLPTLVRFLEASITVVPAIWYTPLADRLRLSPAVAGAIVVPDLLQ